MAINEGAADSNNRKCRAICILGMHRSGTSAITRAVNFLGAYLGEEADVCRYFPDNPEGVWESLELQLFNDRLLSHLNASWYTTLPLEQGWHLRKDMKPFRNELAELIKKKFSGCNLWAWKDPRTSLLLPLWEEVLRGTRYRTIVLVCCKEPA